MKFIEIKINEEGEVSMKDEKKSELYKEECAMNKEFCATINADKKLKVFFKEQLGKILQTYAGEMINAFAAKDRPKAAAGTQQAGESIKGLMMLMFVKVMMKKKAE